MIAIQMVVDRSLSMAAVDFQKEGDVINRLAAVNCSNQQEGIL